MSGRLPIVAGLSSGAVAGVLLVAIVALIPELLPAAPEPSNPAPTASASAPAPSLASPSGSAGAAEPTASSVAGGANFHIGEVAPSLRVADLDGGTIDLAVLRGKPVWVNFMGTYCPPCRDEFPVMNGFHARYAEAGLIVVAVDVREDPATVGAFAESLGTQFRIGLDRDGSAQEAWGAAVLPVHFWVDTSGVIRDGALGGIGPDVMAAGLRTIMPAVEITP